MKKFFINKISRRQFLKNSLSGFALASLPVISFAQSNPDVVVIGADQSGRRAVGQLLTLKALD